LRFMPHRFHRKDKCPPAETRCLTIFTLSRVLTRRETLLKSEQSLAWLNW
jgi:hypothetical protein